MVERDYLGEERKFYQPRDAGTEKKIRERMDYWRRVIARQES